MTKRQRFLVFCLWTLMLIGLSQIGSLANQSPVAIQIDVMDVNTEDEDISGTVKDFSGRLVLSFSGKGTYTEENLQAGYYTIEWTGGLAQSGYEEKEITVGQYSYTLM